MASFAFSESSRPDAPAAAPLQVKGRLARQPFMPPQQPSLDGKRRGPAYTAAAAAAKEAAAAAAAAALGSIEPRVPPRGQLETMPPRDPRRERQLAALRNAVKGGASLGQQLRALAEQEMRLAARTQKHTSTTHKSAISDVEWWHGLMGSLGLDQRG